MTSLPSFSFSPPEEEVSTIPLCPLARLSAQGKWGEDVGGRRRGERKRGAEKTMEMEEMALSQSEEQLATSPLGSAIRHASWRHWQLITKAPLNAMPSSLSVCSCMGKLITAFPSKTFSFALSIPLILLNICLSVGGGGKLRKTWVRPQGHCLMSVKDN